MDWLLDRQEQIEDRLARRHLKDGELVLYDVSCSYFEGRRCELAALGYSRDGKRNTPQIIYGLLCDKPGRPICVEVFGGELHDDKTLPSQITIQVLPRIDLRRRFGLQPDEEAPANTPVRDPRSDPGAIPACSIASQLTSSSSRCCGSIATASRGEIPKNPASNSLAS